MERLTSGPISNLELKQRLKREMGGIFSSYEDVKKEEEAEARRRKKKEEKVEDLIA